MMRTGKRRKKKGAQDYWQSYSDMMAALLLMFVLIMSGSLNISQDLTDEARRDEVGAVTAQKKADKAQAVAHFESINYEAQKKLAEQKEKEAILREQENIELRDKLDHIVGVKTSLISELQAAFADTNLALTIDEKTGAITFDSSILFSYGESTLTVDGQEFLNEFVPKYIGVLMRNDFRESIAEIIIEGHTDSVGGYISNLRLSQERAYAVAEYCLNEKTTPLNTTYLIQETRDRMSVNGRSLSELIYDADGMEDPEASRRVVFKFRLTDEEMIDEMRRILEDHD